MLIPLTLLTVRFRPKQLVSKEMAPALVLAMLPTIYALDSLPNAMANPVFLLAGGAVVSYVFAANSARSRIVDGEPDLDVDIDARTDSIPLRRLHPGSV